MALQPMIVDEGSIFPMIGGSTFNDFEDKGSIQRWYNFYFLDKLLSMFKYDGLPDSLPQKYLEINLLTTGKSGIVRDDKGDLRAIFGNFGGEPNVYFVPKLFYFANPYLDKKIAWKDDQSFKIGEDVEVILNDSMMCGMMPLINRYSSLMMENLLTARIEIINLRRIADITAPDDKTKKSAELYLKRIEEGKIGVMSDNALLDGIKINSLRTGTTGAITNIIEMQQYLKASFYNEIGLNANWNAKRESINSNESQLNDDMLTPLIDNMLKERQEGVDRVNKLFGTDISVEFNSAWKENEEEKEIILDNMKVEDGPIEDIQTQEDEIKDKKEGENDAGENG